MPAEVKAILDSKFNVFKIEDAEVSETSMDKVSEFEKGKLEKEVAIDLNGKVISAKVEKEEKEELDED